MKLKILFVFSLMLICTCVSFSDYSGDLIFFRRNGSGITIHVKVTLHSIPFEGMTDVMTNIWNRQDQLQNGYVFRHFTSGANWPPLPNQINNYPLAFHEVTYSSTNNGQNMLDLGHCATGEVGQDNVLGGWGFAIYKITIDVDQTDEHYYFYWNCLDSKYGKPNWNGTNNRYGKDWFIEYLATEPEGCRIRIKDADNTVTPRIINTSNHDVYSVWKLIYDRDEPFAKDFQARTTPFPISPQLLHEHYYDFKELIIGTTVTLGNVYEYTGDHDRFGYNTIMFYQNAGYYYYTSPPIINPTVNNSPGNTFCTPAWGDFGNGGPYGMTIKAITGNKLIIQNDKRLWVTGYNQIIPYQGDILIFEPGSSLDMGANTQINTCFGGKFIDNGATTVWGNNSQHIAYEYSTLEYYNGEHVINNQSLIMVKNNGTLRLGDNTTLTFDGAESKLWLEPGAHVKLGNNALIKFKNGAFIYANGVDFNCDNGYWQGIVFENSGTPNSMIINNCSFSHANVALSFSNNETTAYYPVQITNNTFNVSLSTGRAITANNIYNYLIQNNTFNLTSGSIGILVNNHYNPVGQGSMTSQLKIIHNTFNNGYLQLYLGSLASQLTPVYVYNNYFYNITGGWCFAGRMITGDIKYNTMQTNSSNTCFGLNQSAINLYRNFISNSNGNSILLDDSYPKMAPVKSQNNQLVWYGGLNILSSGNLDNILFDYSHASLNYGQNKFIIDNPASYHLYGSMPDTTGNYSNGHYLVKNNCWQSNNGLPKTYLYKVSPPNPNIPVEYLNQNYPCEQALNVLGSTINDLGDGIYDTLYFTEDITGDPTLPDEIAYNQACLYRENAAFFDAITSYKNLIDNYNNSPYLLTSLFEIYNCYASLDTADQTHRDLIFNDLKYYLEQKIEQYWYNSDFVSNAYNLVLSCEVMIQNFNEAMTGYEFISLYHPDPDQRLLASMDYGEIQNYLNSGGSESSSPKKKVKTSILKLMDKKPYTKIVKDFFVAGSKVLEKKLNDKLANTHELTLLSKQMVERARQNVNVSRSLTKQQREERRMEDIKLLFKEDNRYSKENTLNIPASYSLHQNYPNPFNPITTIKYELPKDGLISLKIYDILGREIYSINEFKKAGIYDLKFDGSNFASGVYFYRIETGTFVDTKKMVLVK